MARRMTRAFMTGRPSSEIATMPASRMEPMAASSSPRLPLVMAPIGKTLTLATCARALHDVAGDSGAVVHRDRVRHAADAGEAARRRRPRAGLDGLGVLDARLAQMHVHVDKARGDDGAGGVRACAHRRLCRSRANGFDFSVADEHVGGARRNPRGGVDNAARP